MLCKSSGSSPSGVDLASRHIFPGFCFVSTVSFRNIRLPPIPDVTQPLSAWYNSAPSAVRHWKQDFHGHPAVIHPATVSKKLTFLFITFWRTFHVQPAFLSVSESLSACCRSMRRSFCSISSQMQAICSCPVCARSKFQCWP